MRPWLENVVMADWSPDGSTMAVLLSANGKFRLEYPIGHVLLDKLEYRPQAIRVSPDGNLVAYAHYTGKNNVIGISLVDRNGKIRSLGDVSGETSDVLDPVITWTTDGREIWFRSFDIKEWGTIYAIDLNGHRRVVTRLPGHIVIYDMARDGRILLRTDTRQVGILGVAPGEEAERDLTCLDQSVLNGISDDGRIIVATILGESGGPKGSIYMRRTDSSPPVRLGDGVAFAVSPDGKWVSGYYSIDANTRRYVLLPTGAGEERVVSIPQLHGINIVYGWSRDDESWFEHGHPPGHGMRNYLWDSRRARCTPSGRKELPTTCPWSHPTGARSSTLVRMAAGGYTRSMAAMPARSINSMSTTARLGGAKTAAPFTSTGITT